jgi:ATP-dependent helicase HrpB
MKSLPITHVIPEVKDTLAGHNRLVLQAPPGAGKTTALPLALLDAPWLEGRKIIMLEPRRLAVRAAAAHMAQMLGEKVGERIGYQVRMDSVQSERTQLLIVTEGILTRKLQHDPALEDVGLVIFDEFHERSLHADLSLALALESQTLLREDLRLMVMSATLNTDAICTLLDGAPLIQSQGRSYPVERIYLHESTPQPTQREIISYTTSRILKSLEEDEGNILVFLPGTRQIKAVETALNTHRLPDVHIAPLYGNLSKEAQELAILPPPQGQRKVVLATNIAQTSLTIEGIRIVIDSGLENVSVFNPFNGMDSLQTRFISQDAATQRAGRAGRLSAGKAYHLWHASRLLQAHDTPEICLADLSPLLLELAAWGCTDIHTLKWLDTPPATALSHAASLLDALGARDLQGHITPHGRAMNGYGLHPRLSHMMLKAKEMQLTYEASLLAVLLTEKDILTHPHADLKERVEILHDVAQKRRVDPRFVHLSHCRYLLTLAKRLEPVQQKTLRHKHLGLLLAFAYPDRIAQLRHTNTTTYLLSNGKGARLRQDESLTGAAYLIVSDLDAKQTDATIYKALPLTREQILTHLKTRTQKQVTWNETHERVEVREVTTLGKLTLEERQLTSTDTPEVTEVLLEEIEAMGLDVLPWDKRTRRLQERVNFLHHHDAAFPDFSEASLLSRLDTWLAPYLEGVSSLKALRTLDLYPILLGQLSYEETQRLDRLAPEKIKVASGSQIAIDYTDPAQPILAVRLQEMFGTTQTPTLMEGRVTLMLHLLSPAHRPIQMTQDLASFWENTYEEVKKELRGRYKKHYWPDNPLEAQATNKTKKKML